MAAYCMTQAWWFTPLTPAQEVGRQEDQKFKTFLSYIVNRRPLGSHVVLFLQLLTSTSLYTIQGVPSHLLLGFRPRMSG